MIETNLVSIDAWLALNAFAYERYYTEQEQFVDAYENHIIYQMDKLDFNPLIATIKAVRANVADICGSQRETAAMNQWLLLLFFSWWRLQFIAQLPRNTQHQINDRYKIIRRFATIYGGENYYAKI